MKTNGLLVLGLTGGLFLLSVAFLHSDSFQRSVTGEIVRHKRSSGVAATNESQHQTNVSQSSNHNESSSSHDSSTSVHRYQVVTINWARVANPFIISIWIIFAGITKIAFHLIQKYVSRVPESCILICLGLVVGGIAYSIDKDHRIEQLLFNPDTFFLFILPPIVMEAGYFMPKESFFDNLGTILTYAIIGTIFNALCIGSSLFAVYKWGLMPGIEEYGSLEFLHCLLFGSIISAVDPVAVISVFEEIHVNTVLYICVFGESLLNDGVAVVLYKMFEGYIEIGQENIIGIDIVAAIASFFVVAFGGLFIGILFGYAGSFITKYTVHNRIVEPTFVFVVCYIAYLSAEIFHLSGIISIVFAAFTMSTYVEHNISTKSHTTVKYGMKMLANIAETIIFMLLGIAAVSDFWQYWNTGFVLWTLFFITLYRAIGVVGLTFVINYIRLDKINRVDQFVMAYGGLRGAIAFSLVSLTQPEHVPTIKTMICSCIVAILFTSFVQGSTIRPIVELLHVKTSAKYKKSMFEDVNLRMIDHVMTGVEDIIGHHGHHYWMQRLQKFNTEYLMRWFVRDPYLSRDHELLDTFHRINKRDAEDLVEEFERGNSSNEIASGTFANLLLPYEMRRSHSHASFNHLVRQQGLTNTCIDMHALEAQGRANGAGRTLEDADVHHLLQQNLYKPRAREVTRYRRGNLEDDGTRKRQEEEILIRRKINVRHRRHHKHKHNRHKTRSSSKSQMSGGSIKKHSTAPNFVVEQQQEMKIAPPEEDQGITFTAGKKPVQPRNGCSTARNPLGFMSSFDVLPEETLTDVAAEGVEETDTTHVNIESCAIDRELPWKRNPSNNDVVSDPHNTTTYEEPVPETSPESCSNLENVWPSNTNNNSSNPEDGGLHFILDKWESLEEDQI
uniref:sodium/hydrogen exchanger 3-like isoform X2 n=1 Tax=Ciona intestinalis TaxID=7719 RepID=UPI000180C181|nr:sodium/hydrogen exchanger 3-like isoform X2 [Ciona intestinalis]|eukprot:XP_018666770.1 sodium/hydrogen exchanger 3-like isoform X2 [Ciona intestinalis]